MSGGGCPGDCSTRQQQTVTVGDGPVAAAVPGEHFENCTTVVCCFFGVGAAERTGGKEGAQGCVIPRQTGVGGWAVAGFFSCLHPTDVLSTCRSLRNRRQI